jgi:hypothetical protein
LTTGFTIKENTSVLDDYIGLGILAFLAENELVDEPVKVVLQLGSFMGTVDNPTVVGRVRVGLGTEFETEILDYIGPRACQGLGDAAEVDNDSFDTVALAFNLGLEPLHLVAIERILHIAANIDGSHFCGSSGITSDLVDMDQGTTLTVTRPDDATYDMQRIVARDERGEHRRRWMIVGLLTRHSTR